MCDTINKQEKVGIALLITGETEFKGRNSIRVKEHSYNIINETSRGRYNKLMPKNIFLKMNRDKRRKRQIQNYSWKI